MTTCDWVTVNAALALYEAEVEAEEPYSDDPDELVPGVVYSEWETRLRRVRAARFKVHERVRAGG